MYSTVINTLRGLSKHSLLYVVLVVATSTVFHGSKIYGPDFFITKKKS